MDRDEIQSHLSRLKFFKGLADDYLAQIADHSQVREFKPQDLIFHQDRPANEFFVLLDGEAQVEVPALYGPPVSIQSLGKNTVLGWSWLIPPFKWTFDARAGKPTRAIVIDGEALRRKCEEDPRFGYELMKRFASMMSERLDAARMRVMEVYGTPEGP